MSLCPREGQNLYQIRLRVTAGKALEPHADNRPISFSKSGNRSRTTSRGMIFSRKCDFSNKMYSENVICYGIAEKCPVFLSATDVLFRWKNANFEY